RLRSGRITSPPGPRNRSRDEILSGRCQRIGVPVKASFFFLGLAKPVSIEEMLRSRAKTISVRNARIVFIASSGGQGIHNRGYGGSGEVYLINAGSIHKILLTVECLRASHDWHISAVGL